MGGVENVRQVEQIPSMVPVPMLTVGSSKRQFKMNLSFSASHFTGIFAEW